MSTPTAVPTARQRRLRSAAHFAIAALLVAAVVLAVMVWRAAAGPVVEHADVGETMPLQADPYGTELTVHLPASDVTVVVGAPVDRIGNDVLDTEYDDPRWEDYPDLGAPDDGSLVPLSWKVQRTGGLFSGDDPNPIEIRLVAGDQRVDLGSVVLDDNTPLDDLDAHPVAVGLDGEIDPDELAVEVEYDGLIQTAHVASGEIDAGAAALLYDDGGDFTAGCTDVRDNTCSFLAAPTSPVRPDRANLTASYVSLYPYDDTLGWADEGSAWAAVRIQSFGSTNVENAAGDYWRVSRQSALDVTLDGAKPVRREGLDAAAFDTVGRVVFSVAADAEPTELLVEETLTLRGAGAPPNLRVEARMPLTPVG